MGFRVEGWAEGAMAVHREAPGVCGLVVVLGVTGLMGVIWQEGWRRWETGGWSQGGSQVAGAWACGSGCEVGPWLPLTLLSLW